MSTNNDLKYTKKEFTSSEEIKWCPGCGDYAIFSAIQSAMTKIGKKREDIVCVSGIGCSSRLPYYLNTYGYHTIHGRAAAVASGIKTANPELSVWVMTGDGDSLSIGGNHFIHVLRRNVDMNIVLFNNQIYGLTKGQYSPTSVQGQVTKSSPYGSLDRPFSPAKLAFGASATFIARTLDTNTAHMQEVMLEAEEHRGTSFIEVYQNCVIFNDGCHSDYTDKKSRNDHSIMLKQGEAMIFGSELKKGIIFDKMRLKVVELGDKYSEKDCLVHDRENEGLASLLVAMDANPTMPKLYGVIYAVKDVIYNEQVSAQLAEVKALKGEGDFNKLLNSGEVWEVKV
ncbi:2-oxoacid:ferredoxin oxidoreductase subunit beta [Sulfurimonas sp. SAG-AH-194-L11]|nr:2-oxoacid:ferredoxin oxidoreductase subunit beta [Sulfurimonas sp. SAG-AH-194-L11]MDF1877644.1 2-oxoacid:ferredoxin oxidoreductase subunit beta [Sulfurimonas sp. SAG-AH-194-L11]